MVWETSTHGPPDANMVETTGSFLLDTARDLVRGAGARFILLYMPGRGDPETHDGEFVVSYAEAAGVEFVDPRPRFTAVLEQQGAAAYDALFLPDDDHPSASGYRLIAEEMAAWLAAHPDPTSQTL